MFQVLFQVLEIPMTMEQPSTSGGRQPTDKSTVECHRRTNAMKKMKQGKEMPQGTAAGGQGNTPGDI